MSRSGPEKPILLDAFCGAGGATRGYQDAGFEVWGIDKVDQPHYVGDEFIRSDAIGWLKAWLRERNNPGTPQFAAVAASPPCQHDADVTVWRGNQDSHPDLIGPTRELLRATGLPYVLENVRGAVRRGKFRGDLMLCGSMFGLPIRRHRYFETNWHDLTVMWGGVNPCGHSPTDYSFDHGDKQPESVYRDAMGCEWMTVAESREAIPPAYTRWIGEALMAHLETASKEAA